MFSLFQITIHSNRHLPPIHSQTSLHFTPRLVVPAPIACWPQQGTVQAYLHTMATARDCTSLLTRNGHSKGLYKLTYTQWPQQGTVQAYLHAMAYSHTMATTRDCLLTHNCHNKGLLTHTQWAQQGTAYSHTMGTTRDCLPTHNGHNKGLLTHTQWAQQGTAYSHTMGTTRDCLLTHNGHNKGLYKLTHTRLSEPVCGRCNVIPKLA